RRRVAAARDLGDLESLDAPGRQLQIRDHRVVGIALEQVHAVARAGGAVHVETAVGEEGAEREDRRHFVFDHEQPRPLAARVRSVQWVAHMPSARATAVPSPDGIRPRRTTADARESCERGRERAAWRWSAASGLTSTRRSRFWTD